MIGIANAGLTALMISVGHRTGLFDALAGMSPSTSGEIAKAANLDERYVREWLGNMVASQLFERVGQDLGDLPQMFRRGDFRPLLTWLREKIDIHGRRYPSPRLTELVTGRPLSAEPLLKHLRTKFGEVYGL